MNTQLQFNFSSCSHLLIPPGRVVLNVVHAEEVEVEEDVLAGVQHAEPLRGEGEGADAGLVGAGEDDAAVLDEDVLLQHRLVPLHQVLAGPRLVVAAVHPLHVQVVEQYLLVSEHLRH